MHVPTIRRALQSVESLAHEPVPRHRYGGSLLAVAVTTGVMLTARDNVGVLSALLVFLLLSLAVALVAGSVVSSRLVTVCSRTDQIATGRYGLHQHGGSGTGGPAGHPTLPVGAVFQPFSTRRTPERTPGANQR